MDFVLAQKGCLIHKPCTRVKCQYLEQHLCLPLVPNDCKLVCYNLRVLHYRFSVPVRWIQYAQFTQCLSSYTGIIHEYCLHLLIVMVWTGVELVRITIRETPEYAP